MRTHTISISYSSCSRDYTRTIRMHEWKCLCSTVQINTIRTFHLLHLLSFLRFSFFLIISPPFSLHFKFYFHFPSLSSPSFFLFLRLIIQLTSFECLTSKTIVSVSNAIDLSTQLFSQMFRWIIWVNQTRRAAICELLYVIRIVNNHYFKKYKTKVYTRHNYA